MCVDVALWREAASRVLTVHHLAHVLGLDPAPNMPHFAAFDAFSALFCEVTEALRPLKRSEIVITDHNAHFRAGGVRGPVQCLVPLVDKQQRRTGLRSYPGKHSAAAVHARDVNGDRPGQDEACVHKHPFRAVVEAHNGGDPRLGGDPRRTLVPDHGLRDGGGLGEVVAPTVALLAAFDGYNVGGD